MLAAGRLGSLLEPGAGAFSCGALQHNLALGVELGALPAAATALEGGLLEWKWYQLWPALRGAAGGQSTQHRLELEAGPEPTAQPSSRQQAFITAQHSCRQLAQRAA